MGNKLKGKVALITGASTGIGRSIAVSLATEGAIISLNGRNEAALFKTLEMAKERWSTVRGAVFVADLRHLPAITNLILDVKQMWKRIDILVNAAGVYHDQQRAFVDMPLEDYALHDISDIYLVGIFAPTLLCRQAIPFMPNGSKIINISGSFERFGDKAAKGWLPYFVACNAMEQMTVGLAQELRNRQIQVNCISPSAVLTESYVKFFPTWASQKGLCLNPEDVAALALFLASSESDHLSGQIITIRQKHAKN